MIDFLNLFYFFYCILFYFKHLGYTHVDKIVGKKVFVRLAKLKLTMGREIT